MIRLINIIFSINYKGIFYKSVTKSVDKYNVDARSVRDSYDDYVYIQFYRNIYLTLVSHNMSLVKSTLTIVQKRQKKINYFSRSSNFFFKYL